MCIPSFGSETTEIKDPEKLKFIQKFHSWRRKGCWYLRGSQRRNFLHGRNIHNSSDHPAGGTGAMAMTGIGDGPWSGPHGDAKFLPSIQSYVHIRKLGLRQTQGAVLDLIFPLSHIEKNLLKKFHY